MTGVVILYHIGHFVDAGCMDTLTDVHEGTELYERAKANDFRVPLNETLNYLDWTDYECWPRNAYRASVVYAALVMQSMYAAYGPSPIPSKGEL